MCACTCTCRCSEKEPPPPTPHPKKKVGEYMCKSIMLVFATAEFYSLANMCTCMHRWREFNYSSTVVLRYKTKRLVYKEILL